MAEVHASVEVPAGVQEVWAALVDWPRHGRWVPLTVVRVVSGGQGGVGTRFVGRTALGPVGFDDVMEVTAWQPPVGEGVGRCEVVKLGRVLRGRAWFEVVPRGGSTTLVRWAEDVTLALPLGRRVQRLLDPVMRGGLVRVLGRLAEDVGGGRR